MPAALLPSSALTSQSNTIRIPATLLFMLALAIRLFHLGHESLWLDEGFSVVTALKPLLQLLQSVMRYDYNPPTYYLLLHFWMKLFGHSEWAVRLPSALCSAATVSVLYLLAANLLHRRAALAGCLLLILSMFDLRYAQEARVYAFMNLLTVLSMLAMLQLHQSPARRWIALYLTSSLLLLYSHPYGIFPLMAQNLYWLIHLIRTRRTSALSWQRWLTLQTILFILFLPWLLKTVLIMGHIQANPTVLVRPDWRDLAGVIKTLGADNTLFGLTLALLVLFGLIRMVFFPTPYSNSSAGGSPPAWGGLFLALWFGVILIVPFTLSLLATPIFSSRYMIIACPAWYLLAGLGLSFLPTRIGRRAALVLLLALSLAAQIKYFSKPQKEPWRESIAWLEKQAGSGDQILFNADYCLHTIWPCYAQRQDLTLTGYPFGSLTPATDPGAIADQLTRLIAGRRHLWLVQAHAINDPQNRLPASLQQRLGLIQKTDFRSISIYEFGPRPDPSRLP